MTEQEELELSELIGEFSEQLKEQFKTIEEIANKIEDLYDQLTKAEERLKKLEPDETLEQLKKFLEENKPAPVPPAFPAPFWPDPNSNNWWSYSCGRIDCPTRVYTTSGVSVASGIGTNIPSKTTIDFNEDTTIKCDGSTCACGQNPTCQCNK